MGKRQLGELDVGEFVITILLSEIASLPITNPEKSLLDAVIPIATLATLEILTSSLILKFPKIKKLISSKPSVIISHGRLDKKEMRRVRISVEDLVSQIRQNGIFEIDEVDYAILEENGKMSIIPKARNRQPDMSDLNLETTDTGIMHIIISDGKLNLHNLNMINKDKKWLESSLRKQGLKIEDIFCMTVDDAHSAFIQTKDGRVINK
jgi:uncharacterized membrane protein YcaP (DUF421 family)